MDLIYAGADGVDVGVLKHYELDLAYGADENNFELSMPISSYLRDIKYIYCSRPTSAYDTATEHGGIIDSLRVDTANSKVVYAGRTWHGVFSGKVILPPTGSDYRTVTGELDTVLGSIIGLCNLNGASRVSSVPNAPNVDVQLPRYIDAYSAIRYVCASVDYRPTFSFANGYIMLGARPIVDYSASDELVTDKLVLDVTKSERCVNHLVCLGSGELKDRLVRHLYVDSSGAVGTTQTVTGIDEITAVYDYPNAESEAELIKGGIERLEELYGNANRVSCDFKGDKEYGIGDIIGAYEFRTNTRVRRAISKIIVKLSNGDLDINYQVGD